MSVKVMGHIWDQDLKPALKFVLLAYGERSDHEGDNIYPSVDLVSYMTGYSERTVQNATKELLSLGLLEFIKKHPKYRTNVYRYTWVQLLHPAGNDKGGVQETTVIGAAPAPKPLVNRLIQPSVEPDDSDFPFTVTLPGEAEVYQATLAGRGLMEKILFPLMPSAIDYFGTIAGAAETYGQAETFEALMVALIDWKATSGSNGRTYNPHNYGWVEWGINYLASGTKTWKDPNYGRNKKSHPEYTEADRILAEQIRSSGGG
jgi:hypothetical protein